MQNGQNWMIGWIIALVGFPLGGVLASLLIGHLDTALEGLVGGAAAGVVLGMVQMLALRRRLPVDWQWIIATGIGLAAGVSLSVALVGADITLSATLGRAPLTGLLLGAAQWLVLRQYSQQALWWLPVNGIVYTLAWFITAQVIGDSLDQGFVVFGSSGALVYQVLMGLLLWRMLKTGNG